MGIRWPRLRWRLAVLMFLTLPLLWFMIPFDSPIRLAIRFNFNALLSTARPRSTNQQWTSQRPAFPVNVFEDVVFIVKSGFGTNERIPAWLESHEENRDLKNILLIGDFDSQPGYSYNGRKLPLYDPVPSMLEKGSFPDLLHPRLLKYSNLSTAITSGDANLASTFSRSFGWELDALKVMSSHLVRLLRASLL